MNDYLSTIVVNYSDNDPISLEKISELESDNIILIKNKLTEYVYAYDAIHWFIYISENRTHPITKQHLSNEEFWELYFTVRNKLPYIQKTDSMLYSLIINAIQKYHSKKIILKKKNNKQFKIIPESPLFNIKITYFSKKICDEKDQKQYDMTYNLFDNRNVKKIIYKDLSITITCDSSVILSFGF